MRCFSIATLAICVLVSACGPPRPEQVGLEPVASPAATPAASSAAPAASPVADGSCNAELYTDLIGQPISVVDTLNTGLVVRILPADGFVTRDFNPNRLTFTTTRSDEVGRVFCG
ncbi:MAG: I78 family peptidase inhibitor [Pseudomonadota bacterium]